MNCNLINFGLLFSATIATLLISWFMVYHYKEPFISKAFFLLKRVWVYPFAFIGIGAPLMYVSEFNKLFVFASISLMMVVALPDYKNKIIQPFHSAFAFLAGLFGSIGYFTLVENKWAILIYLIPFILLSLYAYKKSDTPVKWVEIFAFIMVELMAIELFYC